MHLQEVLGLGLLVGEGFSGLLWRRLEDGELLVEVFVELQDGGHIAAAIAVVGRRPHRQQGLGEVPLVPFHHQLVAAAHQLYLVGVVELEHKAKVIWWSDIEY
jgi:hypothetical protein